MVCGLKEADLEEEAAMWQVEAERAEEMLQTVRAERDEARADRAELGEQRDKCHRERRKMAVYIDKLERSLGDIQATETGSVLYLQDLAADALDENSQSDD